MTNSRNKGASFEREVANLLTNDLNLTNNIRRILEQTREKHLPDLMLGRWYLECKRYGSGAEPLDAWWKQVLEATKNKGIPALVYKFDRRPIKVRVPLGAINPSLHLDSPFTADLLWDDFIFLLKDTSEDNKKFLATCCVIVEAPISLFPEPIFLTLVINALKVAFKSKPK